MDLSHQQRRNERKKKAGGSVEGVEVSGRKWWPRLSSLRGFKNPLRGLPILESGKAASSATSDFPPLKTETRLTRVANLPLREVIIRRPLEISKPRSSTRRTTRLLRRRRRPDDLTRLYVHVAEKREG